MIEVRQRAPGFMRRALPARDMQRTSLAVRRGGRQIAHLTLSLRSDMLGQACFSDFDAQNDPEAVRALFGRAAEVLHAWGARSLYGPVSGDGLAYADGVLVRGLPGPLCPDNPLYYDALLRGGGLGIARTLRGFRLPIEAPVLAKLERAANRPSIRIERCAPGATRAQCDALCRVMADARGLSPDRLADLLDRLRRPCGRNLFLAWSGAEPAGMLLALPGKDVYRLATIEVAAGFRSGPTCAALLGCAIRAAKEKKYALLEGSVIDGKNQASNGLAQGLKASESAMYRIYDMKL